MLAAARAHGGASGNPKWPAARRRAAMKPSLAAKLKSTVAGIMHGSPSGPQAGVDRRVGAAEGTLDELARRRARGSVDGALAMWAAGTQRIRIDVRGMKPQSDNDEAATGALGFFHPFRAKLKAKTKPVLTGIIKPALAFGAFMACMMFWWVPLFMGTVAVSSLAGADVETRQGLQAGRGDGKRAELRRAFEERKAQEASARAERDAAASRKAD
ncbi:unnamed protein product [Prorocentrum cordatum]|uniref:Uncharacterized protein n=1 Tax=Prorocentrum cordatum TaxID=2364126 RepID=A0ABN9VNS3_9DINO|nr:unnamed protein product [Polarella glacialis]